MLYTVIRIQNGGTGWVTIYSLLWNVEKVVICHTPEISTYSRNIIGLGGVRHGVVIIEEYSLACE
jgi:hypothetical protein